MNMLSTNLLGLQLPAKNWRNQTKITQSRKGCFTG